MNDIKVGYLGRDGHRSTAYIDEYTGGGTDKYSGVPVRLRFDEGAGGWLQDDTWDCAAEVIAWTEGWYPPDPAPGDWADCLTSAAQALAHIHQHKEGTP